jgi:F-type H+-transporting ATPase subunit a
VSSEQVATGEVAQAPGTAAAAEAKKGRGKRFWLVLAALVVALDVVGFLFFPPFPKGGQPGQECTYPVCFINGNLEFPPPVVVVDLDPAHPMASGPLVIAFHPSITSTLITLWIVAAAILVVMIGATRRMRRIPGRVQNVVEFVYEALDNFAVSIGGPEARRYVPIYAGFFLLILFSNWSGLIPPVGKIEQLRAPTSDVNVTIGLALCSFTYFQFQGFRVNGVRGYLRKFFPIGEFRDGIGAGIIGLFVGLIELMLEFVKPVTLSMRLFGNIYGGEVALGVITALTVAFIPLALLGLELMLNFVQALIFSVLTLMFTLAAIETHHPDEGELGHEAADALEAQGAYQEQPVPGH